MISPLMTKLQLMIENTTDQTKAVFEKKPSRFNY